jgi:hypothetical protein
MNTKITAYLIALFLPLASFLQAIPSFTLITVPKAGSHMLIKALYFLTNSPPIWHTKFPSYQYIPSHEGFLYTHFCISPELEADYAELPLLRKIILIRDFRDVAVSIVSQIKKSHWPGLPYEERQRFLKMPFDEQLLFVINFEYNVQAIAAIAPNSLQVSLAHVAEQALRFSKQPGVLTCRYEDLIGPNGNRPLATQVAYLKRLQEFLQLDLPDSALTEIAMKLYGDDVNPFGHHGFANFQSTFQNGVTGRWKDFFKEEHKIAFKKKLGPILIALGYVENDDW